MGLFTENLDAFFMDFAVPVEGAGFSTVGILDMPDKSIVDGMAISTDYTLTVQTDTIPSELVRGDALTVDDSEYRIRELFKIDDGALTRITLARV